ncbi:dihydrofolate reductase [Filobacillus milosensis]|uniref:Dihydrofolate reductase n=1 Tax=Filobacillus milosensis TaxID=94137 RepID=A0A4Y8IQQ7_9BACI|nr:dihydrofolate reductase [Filobacillus milosensis]TFB24012.1 dihydrofolate reductase [Filobacillus milosensis]
MLSFIVAMDENNVIGKDNDLPWYLPNDLKYFKKVTTGYTIVMGRKTYESIGRPLPNRKNIVMTRDQDYKAEGCIVVHSMEELEPYLNDEEVFLIGGAELFKLAWDRVDRLYITKIHDYFEGDTYFPEIDSKEWKIADETPGETDEKNKHEHTYLIYERK